MAFYGSPFQAEIKNGRIEGRGTYTFPNGNVYEGEFKDGHFHGYGTIRFMNGGKFEATWKEGMAIGGKYTFADGLPYELENWEHCTTKDRRLYQERMMGLKPPSVDDMKKRLVLLQQKTGE